MRLSSSSAVALMSVLLATTACAPIGLLAGAGATVGTEASKEGGMRQSLDDRAISLRIHDDWFRYNTDMFSKLNLEVTEGRVLITGVVQNPQYRVDAVRMAWQVPGVKQVINEIKVQNGEGITGYGRDKWIAAQLRSKLVFDKEIESINYNTDTVGGVIYLMGVAQSQAELNKVMAQARSINYVRDVVSYVRVRNQAQSGYGETGSGATNNYQSNSGYNNANNTASQNTTTTSTSSGSNNNATSSNSGGGYDYQPESHRVSAPVESGDLAPVR